MRWGVLGTDKEHVQVGAGADIVAYPVADGKLLNVAAFVYVYPDFLSSCIRHSISMSPDLSPRQSP
jgi:hypothetical protein